MKIFVAIMMFLWLPLCYSKEYKKNKLITSNQINSAIHNRLYFGGFFGYGSTTWDALAPDYSNQNETLNLEVPTSVDEGGSTYGALLGYEINRHFAIESMYLHFPDAKVSFDEFSIFSFEHDGKTSFTTSSESLALMGKLMIDLSKDSMRLFSGVGLAGIHRSDVLLDGWRVGPAFELGINTKLSNHINLELAAVYVTGYGESQLEPTSVYYPFLYTVNIRLVYYF